MAKRFIANESDVTSCVITEYYHSFGIVKNEIFKVKDDENTFEYKEKAWLYLLFKRFFNAIIKVDVLLLEGECVDVYNEEKKIACYIYIDSNMEASINETKEKFRLIGIDCIFILKSLSFVEMKKKIKNDILDILLKRELSERTSLSLKRKFEDSEHIKDTEAIEESEDLISSQFSNKSTYSDENTGICKNRCIICKEDLGITNPRQYCRKTYCPYEERQYKIRVRK